MRTPILIALAAAVSVGLAACRPGESPFGRPLPTVVGTIEVDGLSAPVRILRDAWGVPHVYAESRDDLFVAQGFVQAQDRLFQNDGWRRAAQGRLAEVLGANFIERDAMTRRLQYGGDVEDEWRRYGPEARSIATAFVRGVNACAAIAREQPPELFRLAGWLPGDWAPEDLLNRTDAYARDATIAAVEGQGLPGAVVDSVRRAAVPPFFVGLSAPVVHATGASTPPPAVTAGGNAPDVVASPSPYYLIHLHAPQWNAIGATHPWRPGLSVGHDGRTIWDRDDPQLTARVHVEPLGSGIREVRREQIAVKGRDEPFAFETQVTAAGVVIALDREAGSQFVLDWDGFKPGTAPAFANGPSPSPHERRPPAGTAAVLFRHPLAITPQARARLDVGPLPRPATSAPTFDFVADLKVWDASTAINAPGESEWPASVHFSDQAAAWASGVRVPLLYTDSAVMAKASGTTLILEPSRRR